MSGSSIQGISDSAVIAFGQNYGAIASGDLEKTDIFAEILTSNLYGNANTSENALLSVFHGNVGSYLVDTKQAMMLNDVANTNQFLSENMSKELERTTQLRDKTFNHIHKTRQRYFGKKYAINANRFWATVMQITIGVVLTVALVFGIAKRNTISIQTAMIIAGIIILLYVIILLVFIKQNQLRRKDDWNKFYFVTPQDKARSGRCG